MLAITAKCEHLGPSKKLQMYWSWSPRNFRIDSLQEKQNSYLQSGRSREVVVMRDNSNTSIMHFNVL